MKRLELIFTRDAPVMATGLIFEGYKQFDAILHTPFAETVMIFRHGAMEMFRDMDYVKDVLPCKVIDSIQQNNIDLNQIFDEHENLVRYLQKIKADRSGTFSEQIQEVHKVGSEGFPGMLLSLWIPTWSEKDPTLFDQGIIDRAADIRVKDSLFDDCSTIYYEILNNIARAEHVPTSSLKYMTIDEVLNFLNAKTLPKDIHKRKNQTLYVIRAEVFTESGAANQLKLMGYAVHEETVEKKDAFSGQVAFKGHAKGVVRIIYSRDQMDTFQEGEVLVAPMTTPWYLPIMKKASAFVTDEGGVMCHAAVVARELKKPCIIGTKIATKVLKDGDLVEVDAERGVVKILKEVNERKDTEGKQEK